MRQSVKLLATGTCVLCAYGTFGWLVATDRPDRALAVPTGRPTELVQGRGVEWWSRRAVQARRDANARKQTILRLRRAQRKDAAHFFSWLAGAGCVQSKEGRWSDPDPPYWGGMQASRWFQQTYGLTYYRRWGTADNWPWWAQLHMAYNGWVASGWYPWPATSRACGLL